MKPNPSDCSVAVFPSVRAGLDSYNGLSRWWEFWRLQEIIISKWCLHYRCFQDYKDIVLNVFLNKLCSLLFSRFRLYSKHHFSLLKTHSDENCFWSFNMSLWRLSDDGGQIVISPLFYQDVPWEEISFFEKKDQEKNCISESFFIPIFVNKGQRKTGANGKIL